VGEELTVAIRADTVYGRINAASSPARAVTRRIVGVVTTGVLVLFAMIGALALVLAIATHFAPSGTFTVAGHPMLVVLSGSMSPAIGTGDMIIDEKLSGNRAGHLQAGQIITFYPDTGTSTSFTHRIAEVTSAGGQVAYVTKGDANNAPDATLVAPSQILGLYDAKIPGAGYAMYALRQPLTLGLLLAAPILWFISGLLLSWAREMEEPAGEGTPATSADPEGGAG
jgi:signal peptidase